jgi:hypothetical protein
MIAKLLNALIVAGLHFERRFEPFFRPYLDATLREPVADVIQYFINRRRTDEGLKIAEERPRSGEEAALDSIINSMGTYMRTHYQPGTYQRAGNTKTHGIVRGEVIIHDDMPADYKHGIFAAAKTYPAWVRFSGPGPDSPPDIEDVGFVSIGIKMMGVPGPKLMEDEKFTQDLVGICTPTFVTPDTFANSQLQAWIVKGTPVFYFFNWQHTHLLDMLMQALWNETQYNPLEARYYSCVPYLLGEGRAMLYSVRPKLNFRSKIPRLPFRPPDNYLRDAMVATLAQRDVEFDILVQLQTDPFLMPIENAAVRWPEKLSPFVPVATLKIPRQRFDSPAQLAFAHNLSYNPWHCIPEHRPLGNQSRARRRLYWTLSQLRQTMNGTPHIEPSGKEVFD